MAKQVFLSYSTDDTPTATIVRDHLEAQDIGCWMAPRDIAPGKDYGEQIINAIEEAIVLLLILSESSNYSIFVRNEVESAVSKGKSIIPFRIQPVQPSRSLEFFISNAQWIDGWELVEANNWDLLAHAIQDYLGVTTHPHALVPSPPLVTSPPPNNLPYQLTPFIGREAELTALDRLLAKPDTRLITVLGPGGMGKTRLALAAAQGHLADPHFANGIYFVALAPLSTPQHIVLALADVLSVTLQPGGDAQTPQQQLLEYLRPKQMLLLFDNFEHLLDGAELLAQILQAAPQVRVLATSRERLRIPGEHLFPIQGLDYNLDSQLAGQTGSPAVQLFVQSARQIVPELELAQEERALVTNICRLVGGMPLGIELAASWIELLSPAEIVAEIERSLDFLEAERRGGQEQHRSIRAVFDSTWQRLDHTEQNVFVRLALFRGGFTREAAEQVAGASLRVLSALVGKSLVQHEREKGRYFLHELLRQFALERLLADPQIADETHERLCTYYATFLQQQEARLKIREYAAAMSAIEVEIDNIRTAWQWGVAHHQIARIERSVEALWIFYNTKLWIQEGATFFGSAASALRMDESAREQGILLARILTVQAWFLAEQHFHMGTADLKDMAQALYLQSLEIFDKLGAPGERGDTLLGLAVLSELLANGEQALEYAQKALTLFTEKQDLWKINFTLVYHGIILRSMGKYQQAIQSYRQGVAISEQCGDLRSLGDGLCELGTTLKATGEFEEAKRVAEKSLEVSRALGNKYQIARSFNLLGELAWHMGDFLAAQQHAEASLALFQELGLTQTQTAPRITLGNVACSLGDLPRARFYFYPMLEAFLKAATQTTRWFRVDAVIGMALVLAQEDKTTQAMELLTAVLPTVDAWQEIKERAAKLLAELEPEIPSQSERPARPLDVVIAELLNE